MTANEPEFYQDKAKEWRWRIKSANKKVLADSGEGYRNLADAEKALTSVLTNTATD